jgi:Protein of unknown function (DUF1822)
VSIDADSVDLNVITFERTMMSIQSLNLDQLSLPFPIPSAALEQADRFTLGLTGPKAQQVRRNTLAVWVVNEYFNLVGFPTDLAASDSWHSVAKLIDTADLVTSAGTLECRAIEGAVDLDRSDWKQKSCMVPPEVWGDRCGYVFVQLDEANQMAEILGFLPQVEEEAVSLDQLQPFEMIFEHLEAVRSVTAVDAAEVARMVAGRVVQVSQGLKRNTTTLGRWLQNQVSESWHSLENIVGLSPSYAFRSRSSTIADQQMAIVRRGKEISFGNWDQPSEVCQVTLVTGVKSMVGEATRTIELGLYPVLPQTQLPRGLTVQIVDGNGEVFLQPETIVAEELLEFEFGGASGEAFSVILEWAEYEMREEFVI